MNNNNSTPANGRSDTKKTTDAIERKAEGVDIRLDQQSKRIADDKTASSDEFDLIRKTILILQKNLQDLTELVNKLIENSKLNKEDVDKQFRGTEVKDTYLEDKINHLETRLENISLQLTSEIRGIRLDLQENRQERREDILKVNDDMIKAFQRVADGQEKLRISQQAMKDKSVNDTIKIVGIPLVIIVPILVAILYLIFNHVSAGH